MERYASDRAATAQEPFSVEGTVVFTLSHAHKRFDESPPLRIKERWNTGAKVMENLWGHSPRVYRVLQELKKLSLCEDGLVSLTTF